MFPIRKRYSLSVPQTQGVIQGKATTDATSSAFLFVLLVPFCNCLTSPPFQIEERETDEFKAKRLRQTFTE